MNSILVYEGKAKNVYSTEKNSVLRLKYLDQATALNGKKKDLIQGKGELNNQITSLVFSELNKNGISNHWIKNISKTEQLVKKVDIIPLEVVLRNIATGSFTKRLGIEEGTVLAKPIIEFYYKDDSLDDPFINEDHIEFLEIATKQELDFIKEETLKINNVLTKLFDSIDITLVDFKLEFGKDEEGNIILSDEITPDTCRLWDKKLHASLDKDVYRKDLGDIIPVYQEVLTRLQNKGEKSMFNVRVFVSYKESVLDPQAEVIEGAIKRLGYHQFSDVKLGKFFDFEVSANDTEQARNLAEEISDKLLANINMESYQIVLLEDN